MLTVGHLPNAFEAMLQHMQAQANQADQLVALAQPELLASDPQLLVFSSSLAQLEDLLRASAARLAEEEAALAAVQSQVIPGLQALQVDLQAQRSAADAACAALAASTPAVAQSSSSQLIARSKSASHKSDAPRSAKKKARESLGGSSASQKKTAGAAAAAAASTLSVEAIRMEHVTPEEFESIPKYMRGRLPLAVLNSSIDAWVGLLREKYALLATARSSLKSLPDAALRRVHAWSAEETDDTRSAYWLSAEDLRAAPELQAMGTTNLKAVLVGLRHLGRVKTATAAGTPKYVLQ